MLCPACKSKLKRAKLTVEPPIMLEICPACRGAWFDMGELTQLDGSVWGNMERHPYHDVQGDHPDATCPKCKKAMYDGRDMEFPLEPLSPADAPDLIIDRCPSCFGFWLDPGELKRLVKIGNTYDKMKRDEREIDRMIVQEDRGAMSIVWAWDKLSDEAKEEMLDISKKRIAKLAARNHKIPTNSLGLETYRQEPRSLRAVIDVWYEMPKNERAELIDLMPKKFRPKPTTRYKPPSRKPEKLEERPADWSWMKWAAYKFRQHLAADADDIF